MSILIKKFGGWILAALSMAASILMFWRYAKQSERMDHVKDLADQQEAQAIGIIKQRIETAEIQKIKVENANQVKQDSSSSSDADVIAKLRNKWSRD